MTSAASPWSGLGARFEQVGHFGNAPGTAASTTDSKTARMRAHLVDHGPTSAADLAKVAGLTSSGLVGALLKHDMAHGRVQFSQGLYHWIESDEAAEIREAIGLLQRHGYTVKAP